MQQNGSFILGSPILRVNQGTTFEKIKTLLRKITHYSFWLTPKKKKLQFYPPHPIWSLFMPGKMHFFRSEPVAVTSSHQLNPGRFLSVVLPGCSLHPFWRHTGQVSAHSARDFQFYLHRALLFHYRKSGNENSALPLAENHNSGAFCRHWCLGYTQKTPAHPQNNSWACLDLKNIMSLLLMSFGFRFMKKIYFWLNKHTPVDILTLQRIGRIRCKWLLMKLKHCVLVLEFRASFLGLGVPD